MAASDADDATLQHAAAVTGLDEVITRLPLGWESRGRRGRCAPQQRCERQRVSMARAIVKDAPVVILDETTAASTRSPRKHVTRAIRELADRATVIVIAHRLGTVAAADLVVRWTEAASSRRVRPRELRRGSGPLADFWAERERPARGASCDATDTPSPTDPDDHRPRPARPAAASVQREASASDLDRPPDRTDRGTASYDATAEFFDVMARPHWDTKRAALVSVLESATITEPVVDGGAGTVLSTSVIWAAVPRVEVLAVEPSAAMRAGA